MKNESFSKKHLLEKYITSLCLVATLKWVEKLFIDFFYLVLCEMELNGFPYLASHKIKLSSKFF